MAVSNNYQPPHHETLMYLHKNLRILFDNYKSLLKILVFNKEQTKEETKVEVMP